MSPATVVIIRLLMACVDLLVMIASALAMESYKPEHLASWLKELRANAAEAKSEARRIIGAP